MANIKVKELSDTSSVSVDNEIMVLTNDANNLVQNITVENLLTSVISADADNVLEQGTDGKLYVETPETITGDLVNLTTSDKSNLVSAINEVNSDLSTAENDYNSKIGSLSDLDTTIKSSVVDAINEIAAVAEPSLQYSTINNSKGMLTGEISADTTILADIKYYAHSTYCGDQPSDASPLDPKKFTYPVGHKPNITDDGIISGFSASNYLSFNSITLGNNFEINCKFTTGNSFSAYQTVLCFGVSNTDNLTLLTTTAGKFALSSSNSHFSAITHIDATANTTYLAKITVQNSTVYLGISTDSGSTWVTYNTTLTSPYNNALGGYIGWNYGENYWLGSIDLKQFSITVDGIPVFSGNKTGIDTIKADDYTVVGTPTISDDGIASGFSGSNYVYCPTFSSSANSWEVDFNFKLNSAPSGTEYIIGDGHTNNWELKGFMVRTDAQKKLTLFVSDETNTMNLYGTKVYDVGVTYYIKAVYTGTGYALYWSTDGKTYTQDGTTVTSNIKRGVNVDYIYFGVRYVAGRTPDYAFNGSIDLNAIKIYADGNLVYQPCLKIPYTLSKTGSKVVDSYYRPRVSDMYEQFGYAPYYTLSDADFTLPQGEIYGSLYDNWVYDEVLVNNTTGNDLKGANIDVDLSSILPKDNNKYLCIFRNFAGRADGATSNNFVTYSVKNNILLYDQVDSGTSATDLTGSGNQFEAIIDINRIINIVLTVNNTSYPFTEHKLYLIAYKPIK